MAKYVARVRKDANAYRYFYSPAEYQAYIKAKGKAIGDKVADAVSSAKKQNSKYVHIDTRKSTTQTTENANSPNAGKMQDVIYKTLNNQQRVTTRKEEHKERVTKRMNEAADKRAYSSGYVKVDDPNLPNVNVRRFTESGPAADAKAKANELEAKRTLKKKYVK